MTEGWSLAGLMTTWSRWVADGTCKDVLNALMSLSKVWNPEREECLHTLSGHTNRVYSLQVNFFNAISFSLHLSLVTVHKSIGVIFRFLKKYLWGASNMIISSSVSHIRVVAVQQLRYHVNSCSYLSSPNLAFRSETPPSNRHCKDTFCYLMTDFGKSHLRFWGINTYFVVIKQFNHLFPE